MSHWLTRSIVELKGQGERVDLVSLIIDVLKELVTLNNFNGIMEVISALDSSAVRRLKYTWAVCCVGG